MKILFVWSAAEMSTYDVAYGIRNNLNAEIADYKLFNRIKLHTIAATNITPPGYDIDLNNVCLLASEGIVYKAVMSDCDWVFIISGMALHPNVLLALKKLGKKIAIWFTEAPYNTNSEQELYLDQFCDIAFVNERTVLDKFHNAVYLPHSFDVNSHHPVQSEKDIDVVFIGSGFPDRHILLENINFENINFVLGGMWPGIINPNVLSKYLKYPEPVNNKFVSELYSRSKIGLNIHRYFPGAESCNPRIFELAATKTFIISDYREEIRDIFQDSVITFEPGDYVDLEYKIRFYLDHPEIREQKAEEAYVKVQDFNFANRGIDIIEALECFEIKEFNLIRRVK